MYGIRMWPLNKQGHWHRIVSSETNVVTNIQDVRIFLLFLMPLQIKFECLCYISKWMVQDLDFQKKIMQFQICENFRIPNNPGFSDDIQQTHVMRQCMLSCLRKIPVVRNLCCIFRWQLSRRAASIKSAIFKSANSLHHEQKLKYSPLSHLFFKTWNLSVML